MSTGEATPSPAAPARILVVDDEDSIREGFRTALARSDARCHVTTASSGEEGLDKLRAEDFDLVFTDLKMPGLTGLDVLEQGKKLRPDTDFVMMTGFGSIDTAVGAMKRGAVDYLEKPFTQDELVQHMGKVQRLREDRLRAREEQQGFLRFSGNMRGQHIILMITFTLLGITGVPLLFPNAFKGVFFFEDSSYLRGLMHRVSAVGLILLSCYHVTYLFVTDDGHRNLRDFLPRLPRDVLDAWGSIKFNLGLQDARPRAARYDFIEKFEYFGVVWGSFIMVVTGLALWFNTRVLQVAPLWVVDLAKVVHRYEAILAMLTIAVWHMYCVHWRPGVFPMSRVWLDGRISREEMIEHHPLEYERITGRPASHNAAKEVRR